MSMYVLRDNPGLKPQRDDLFTSAYRDARKDAAAETGLPLSTFPDEPQFALNAIEDETFLPSTTPT